MGSDNPDTPEDGPSPFTQANFVGLFLTLMLCLLTQPWGSLVYPPPKDTRSRTVRAVFFTWRISPLACAIEAVLILASLLATAIQLIRHSQRPEHPAIWTKQFLSHCAHEFHVTAAALLLLRANGDADGPIELLLAEPFRPLDLGPPVAITRTDPEGHVDVLAQVITATEITSNARPATAEVGVDQISTRPLPPSHGAMEGIKAALRSTAFAYKEKWVDVMAVTSVFITTIKLVAITVPWQLRTAAALLLGDWYAVQLLLWLFHLRDLNTNAAVSLQILSTARRRRKMLWSSGYCVWGIRLAVLPLVIYLGIITGKTLFFLAETEATDAVKLRVAYFPGMGPTIPDPQFFPNGVTAASMARLLVHLPLYLLVMTGLYTIGLVPWVALLIGMLLAGHSAYQSGRRRVIWSFWLSAVVSVIGYYYFFGYYLQIDQARYVSLMRTLSVIATALFLYWFTLDAYRGSTSGSEAKSNKDGLPNLIVNIFIWAYMLEYAIVYCESEQTYKPEWLEYLG